jgi:hypothetical protein
MESNHEAEYKQRLFLVKRLILALNYYFLSKNFESSRYLKQIQEIQECQDENQLKEIYNSHNKVTFPDRCYNPTFGFDIYCMALAKLFFTEHNSDSLRSNIKATELYIGMRNDMACFLCCCMLDCHLPTITISESSDPQIMFTQFKQSDIVFPDLQQFPKEIIEMMDDVCKAYRSNRELDSRIISDITDEEFPSKRLAVQRAKEAEDKKHKIYRIIGTVVSFTICLLSSFALFGGVFPNIFSVFHFPYLVGRSFLAYTIAFAIISCASLVISIIRILGFREFKANLCNSDNSGKKFLCFLLAGQPAPIEEKHKEVGQEIQE